MSEIDVLGQAAREAFGETRRRCTATNRSGERCGRAPIVGGFVCDMHGGKSPQAQRSARRRLTAMVDPALDALMRCLDCGDMRVVRQAAVDILDRCGFGPQATLTLEPSFAKLQHELQDMTTDELAERAEHVAHKLRVATQLQLPEADEQGEGGIIEVEGAIPHGD